ncbi:hypothetical protein NE237_016677 [Protea cynaroides]|uniref:RING-type domain-containing protein n=1 Tax=Protea cynaroides TaxID=273540 RepID=A0A9Q0HEL9_9MAGN|nr:hypothetical protein NE237_016677 [Protea cynaroides]
MYRPVYASPSYSIHLQENCARLLAPVALWLCVSVTLQYGYFGNCRMVLGPNSSRLLKASSIFVEKIQVDSSKKGAILYGFEKKPELSLETNWNVSKYLVVGSYRQQGFALWLNKGSKIHVRWEAPISNFSDLLVVLTKGEEKLKTSSLSSSNLLPLSNPTHGHGQAEYIIEEDDSYHIHFVNMNSKGIIMMVNVNVSSKMYDINKALRKCSEINGLCQLQLLFPHMKFVVLTTPNNGDLGGWDVELSFVARLVTYFALLGFAAVLLWLILKYLGVCGRGGDGTVEEVPATETNPLLQEKRIQIDYGTSSEDPDSRMCDSSEDLYDGTICVICYDKQRDCFFVPCGHCATCYECAQRIIEGENKICPICRRFIHKGEQDMSNMLEIHSQGKKTIKSFRVPDREFV